MGSVTRGGRTPRPTAERAAMIVVAAGALLLVVLLASTAGSPIATMPDRDVERLSGTVSVARPTGDRPTPRGPLPSETYQTPTWLYSLLTVALVAGALVLLGLLLRWLRDNVRLRRRESHPAPPPVPPEAALDALLEDRSRHWSALAEGTPDDAVIAMWVALERSVARVGIERSPAETSGELTLRVLDRLTVDGGAVRTLATLYREARFSGHALSDADRARARDALERVHASLRRRGRGTGGERR